MVIKIFFLLFIISIALLLNSIIKEFRYFINLLLLPNAKVSLIVIGRTKILVLFDSVRLNFKIEEQT